MFDTTAVKDRIATTTNTVSDAAKTAASTAYDKGHEIATGLPKKAIDAFYSAFERAMESFAHYGVMATRAQKNGYRAHEEAWGHLASAWSATDSVTTLEAANNAIHAFASGNLSLLVGTTLGIPLGKALTAGVNILKGTVTLGAIAEMAIPVIFVIAVGYAGLKARDFAEAQLRDLSEKMFDRVRSMDADDLANAFTRDDDDEDIADAEVVFVDEEADADDFVTEDAFKEGATDA